MARLASLALLILVAGCGDRTAVEPRVETKHFVTQPRLSMTAPANLPDGRWQVARLLERAQLRARPAGRVTAVLKTRTEFGSRRVLGVLDRRGDWLRVLTVQGRGWIPAAHVRVYGTDMSIHIDRSARRLVLREGDRAVLRAKVAVGRPGTETPLGRFVVTDRLKPSASDSPYGCCLLALDGHQKKLLPGWPGGDRLAIHHTSAEWSIGQAASLGCVRVRKRVAQRLMQRVPLGAPVFIRA